MCAALVCAERDGSKRLQEDATPNRSLAAKQRSRPGMTPRMLNDGRGLGVTHVAMRVLGRSAKVAAVSLWLAALVLFVVGWSGGDPGMERMGLFVGLAATFLWTIGRTRRVEQAVAALRDTDARS